jgi:hypothetical protein
MTPQQKASWIRRLFTLFLLLLAAAGGIFFVMPKDWWKKSEKAKPGATVEVTEENIAEVQASPGKLTVTNLLRDGEPNSQLLKEIVEKLKKEKYGEKVTLAELNVTKHPKLAAAQGVDLEKFAGQLDFHTDGKKIGQLLGETDPKRVEHTIDRMLAGLLQIIDKNWLPEVPGMQRDKGQPVLEIKPTPPGVKPTQAPPP